jgi:hypothetical protein
VVSEWELTCLAVVGHKVDLWQVSMVVLTACVLGCVLVVAVL